MKRTKEMKEVTAIKEVSQPAEVGEVPAGSHEPAQDQLTPSATMRAAVQAPAASRGDLYSFAIKVVALGFTSVTLCGSLWLADSLDGQISPLVSYGFYGGAWGVALGGLMILMSRFRS